MSQLFLRAPLIIFLVSSTVFAAAQDEIEKACAAAKKPKSVCSCIARNVRAKSDLSDEQLKDIALAVKGTRLKEDDKTTSFDAMADFVEGLESRCKANGKYTVEKD